MARNGTDRARRASRDAAPTLSGSASAGWNEFREPWSQRLELPSTPFARVAFLHGVSVVGDTLVSIALAKTLFFVSPAEARGKVLLYLLLTLAPFAVVSPLLGPLLDRHAARRQWLIVGTSAMRALLCLFLARDYDGLWLFPEAFGLLVLAKGYAIGRSSLVPLVVTRPTELVRANSKLALVAGLAGFVAVIPGGLLSLLGPPWVLTLAVAAFSGAAFLASRLVLMAPDELPRPEASPAVDTAADGTGNAARGRTVITTMRLAALSMSVERGLIGFITFLVAFTFKREGAPTWWLGVVATAGGVGVLLGSAIAPRLRRRVDEMTMLSAGLVMTAVVSAVAAVSAGRAATCFVALTVAVAASCGRLAFDALVQRDREVTEQGSAFARYETRFQLSWVLGALIPVALTFNRTIGLVVMAVVAGLAVLAQAGGERSLAHIDSTLAAGKSAWHKPARPSASDWQSLGEPDD